MLSGTVQYKDARSTSLINQGHVSFGDDLFLLKKILLMIHFAGISTVGYYTINTSFFSSKLIRYCRLYTHIIDGKRTYKSSCNYHFMVKWFTSYNMYSVCVI